MNIIAFDPGETVGIAVLIDGQWVMGMTVPEKELNEVVFRSLIMIAEPTIVVIEALPTGVVHQKSHAASQRIKKWFAIAGYSIAEVNPGQWKGMAKRIDISGTHQKDAATMGLWYWSSRLVNILHE